MTTGEPRWPLILKVRSFVPLLCTAAAISPHGILFYCFVCFTESPNWVYLSFVESSHPLWSCLHPAVANLFPCEVAHLVFLSGGFPRLAFMLPCLVTLHQSAFWAPWWQAAGGCVSTDGTREQIFYSKHRRFPPADSVGTGWRSQQSRAAPLRVVHLWSFASHHKPWFWVPAFLGNKQKKCLMFWCSV